MKYVILFLIAIIGLGAFASQTYLGVGYTGKTNSHILPMPVDRAYEMFIDAERPSGSPAGLILSRRALKTEHVTNHSIIYTIVAPDRSISQVTLFFMAEENNRSSVRAEINVPEIKRANGLTDYPQPYFAKTLDVILAEIAQRANGEIKTHFPVGGQTGAFLLGLEAAFDPEATRMLETNVQASYNKMELNSIDVRNYINGTSDRKIPDHTSTDGEYSEPESYDADGWAVQ